MKLLIPLLSLVAFSFQSGFKIISARPQMNEYMGSQFQLADGRSCIVFENIPDFEKLSTTLWQTCQNLIGGDFQTPKPLLSSETARLSYIQNPRIIELNGRHFLYFNAYDEKKDEGFWGRAEISEHDVGPLEWLTSPLSLRHQERAWIYPKVLSSGEVLLTYEAHNPTHTENELHFALSTDGIHFSADQIYQHQAQMTRFEEFADGTWALVYQVGYGSRMMDYIRLSKDRGATFSAPLPVSSQSNVHDPIFLKRTDGNLDVYYIVWHGMGFGLHRRQVHADGRLGAEEKLTDSPFNLQKPSPFRLAGGRIFVNLGKVDFKSDGRPTSDLIGRYLDNDAP